MGFTHDIYNQSGAMVPTCYFKSGCPSKDPNPNAIAGVLASSPTPPPAPLSPVFDFFSSDVHFNLTRIIDINNASNQEPIPRSGMRFLRTVACHHSDPDAIWYKLQQNVNAGGLRWLDHGCGEYGAVLQIH